MEENRIKLRLVLAQQEVELEIEKEWERYYKEAEKRINERFYNFARTWKYKDHQDIFAKILLDFVVRGIDTEEILEEYREDLIPKMKQLKELSEKLNID